MSNSVHAVDERLPIAKLIPLGLQHVLVMYAGSVAVPLIVGRALNLPTEKIAVLVNADLFACGIATLIQSFGIGIFGIRLPDHDGRHLQPRCRRCSPWPPCPEIGLSGILGAVITGGLFGLLVAPFMQHALRFFPSVVTGTTSP